MPINPFKLFQPSSRKTEETRSEGLRTREDLLAFQLAEETKDLYPVLEANNIRESTFQIKHAPYIISDAVAGEYVIQVYSTEDAWLLDILVDGTSIKDEVHPAWFALTTHRVATGRVSKNWKEQLATRCPWYREVTGASRKKEEGKLIIEDSAGGIEVVFDPQLNEEVLAAFQTFIDHKRETQAPA